MANFYNDVLQKAEYFKAVGRVRTVDALEPITRAAVEAIMKESSEAGTPLILFETYRSAQRQKFMYDKAAAPSSTVDAHHYGLAADLVKDVGGQPSRLGSYAFLRDLAVKHGLVSGLDWGDPAAPHNLVDACHVQRLNVADQEKLLNGSWYPPDDYTVTPEKETA